ncbi:hypothetical protein GCM10023194_73850 [Planotetraspora phitsanulokensis]|uniref:Uncharacterized protein n=1 Tax=Planotetraspora phitsanulokensis TaxID=575192 RepID=A0A8J3XE77_9ACTN|nr:hypothetical protein Pph01_21190 [Planotetraspora phitsanulokensis]
MTHWFRSYWDEADIWFYFEVDESGWVVRQVELQGPDGVPVVAASLEEWQHAQAAGRVNHYEATYGGTAERPVQEWDEHFPHTLTRAQFEAVWEQARRALESGA